MHVSTSTVWKQEVNFAQITRLGIAARNKATPSDKIGSHGPNVQKLAAEELNIGKDVARMKLLQIVLDKVDKKENVTEQLVKVDLRTFFSRENRQIIILSV